MTHRRTQTNRAVLDPCRMAWLTAFCWCLCITPASYAQTTSLSSSGLNTQVQLNAGTEVIDGTTFTRHDITGGTRSAGGMGTNLFHSFGDFSVGSNQIANFVNGDGLPTNNILSRVTGGNPSHIFGMLRTTGFAEANLYLFNPSGMLFGPGASLDVAGSVHFSTASYLNVGGGRFDLGTTGPQVEVLTSAPVTAFGFLGPAAAGVTVEQAVLQVPEGETLSVDGGDVTMTGGTLVAQGGRINVASVASAGEVTPNLPGDPAALDVDTFTGLGAVRLADGAQLDASGASPGGTVLIRGGQLVLTEGAMVNTGTQAGNPEAAGTIDVQTAASVTISSAETVEAGLFSRAQGSGDGGTIIVATDTLELAEGGRISAVALGDADGQGADGTVNLNEVTTVTLSGGFIDGVSTGEISLDGSLGTAGAMPIPKVNDIFTIDEGLGDVRGNNLFFSFSRFRLMFGETARFTGSGTVTNIIARLTGGELMVIDGTLHVDIPGANLYALAPHGVLYGAQGSLNLSGSAHLSTANYLRFGDDARFASNLTGMTTLTDSTPVAYGFGNGLPASLTFRANRVGGHAFAAVADNQILAVVGGEVTVIGSGESEVLSAPGGRIDLASVASNGEVIPNAPGQAPELQVDSFSTLGEVALSASESGVLLQTRGDGGGTVLIRGNSLTISDATISATTEGPLTGPLAGVPGAGIDVNVRGEILLENASFLRTNVQPEVAEGIGSGGIRLTADRIEFRDNSALSSVVSSASTGGGSGDISIIANNDVVLTTGAGVETGTESSADAGDIFIKARNLELHGGVVFTLSTNATGQGGDITVEAEKVLLSNPTLGGPFTAITAQTSGGLGRGGNVRLLADNLEMLGGGNTNISSQTFGPGQGGNLDLQIAGELFASGSAANPFNVGFFANTFSTGNAGNLSVSAGTLRLNDHVGLQSSSFFGAPGKAGNVDVDVHAGPLELLAGGHIGAAAIRGTGPGGTLNVTARDITISGISDSLAPFNRDFTGFSTATNAGVGGTMTVAADSILVTNKGQINSLSIGGGKAGNVIINLDSGALDVTDGGVIISSAFGAGDGGTIDITAGTVTVSGTGPFVDLSNNGISGIVAQAGINGGEAGGVLIKAQNVLVLDGASIGTDTFGPGAGGRIDIDATNKVTVSGLNSELEANFIAAGANPTSARANISAESAEIIPAGPFGSAGDVIVSAPTVEVRDRGLIRTSTTTDGDAGDITLKATTFDASGDSIISSSTSGEGNAGRIGIEGLSSPADLVTITDSAILTISEGAGAGQGGNIAVSATEVGLEGATISATANAGNAGGIAITDARTATLMNSTVSTESITGAGGSISIAASTTMALTDTTVSASVTGGKQAGGAVTLTAPTITMAGGAVEATTAGAGPGGSLTLAGDNLSFTRGARVDSSTTGPGQGGTITLTAEEDVFLSGLSPDGQRRSGVFAKTQTAGGGSGSGGGGGGGSGGGGGGGGSGGGGAAKPGPAGNIVITAKNLFLEGGAQIDSSTTSGGAGGNVTVMTGEGMTIAGTSTRVKTDATRGDGPGGNIVLQGRNISIRDDASVTASTAGKGGAGSITMTAVDTLLLQSGGSVTTSTSGEGNGGTIGIQANQVILDGPGTSINADTLHPFADLSVTLDIEHTNDGDLVVRLDSPDGSRIALLSRVGGSGDNFTMTILDDQATVAITDGSAPFTGTFTPREPLAQLIGEGATGTWKLILQDRAAGETGQLLGWSLRIGDRAFQATAVPIAIPDNGFVNSSLVSTVAAGSLVQGVGEAAGNGGDINLDANAVSIRNDATLSATTRGSGRGGAITVNAPSVEVTRGSIRAETQASGDGGSVVLRTGGLVMRQNSSVTSSSTGTASGDAGTVTIQGLASPAKIVDLANSSIITASDGVGRGGSIVVDAGSLNVSNTTISASVTDLPEGDDPAGGLSDINLTASQARITGGRVEAETRGTRAGGDITMNVGTVALQNGTEISSSSTGGATGTAGNVTIQGVGGEGTKASVVAISESSKITTEAEQASGGSITIQADDRVTLTDSTISTSVFGPEGTSGGNISIDPQFVVLKNSQIIARAFEGRGGNIQITAGLFLADANSIVDASSQFGVSGTVTIQSPLSNLSGALAPMPEAPLEAAALLRAACAARMQGGQASSFVQAGRGGPASEPGGWLGSPMPAAASAGVPASPSPAPGADGGAVAVSSGDPTLRIRSTLPVSPLTRLLAPDGHLVCSL